MARHLHLFGALLAAPPYVQAGWDIYAPGMYYEQRYDPANPLWKRQSQGPVTVIDPGYGFSFIGCYNDLPNSRALSDKESDGQTTMTVEFCAQFCQGYSYMGVEFGYQCFCGNQLNGGSRQVNTESGKTCGDPAYVCPGNRTEQCGGYGTFDFYAQPSLTTTAYNPQATGFTYVEDSFIYPSANGYNYIGCYNDPSAYQRALNGNSTAYGAQTVESCADFCQGYTYMGLENGHECYCGNSIDNGAHLVDCQDECYQCCADDLSERCGGYFRLSMYEVNGPQFVAPSQSSVCTYNGPATAQPTQVVTTDASGSTTSFTETDTYYGPITTGTTVFTVTTTDANGSPTEYPTTVPECYGGNCNAGPHTPGGSATTTNMPTYTAHVVKESCNDCEYQGCFDDNGQGRTLEFQQSIPGNQVTQESCTAACLAAGYTYAGVEFGTECYCDSMIRPPHQQIYGNTSTSNGILLTCDNPQYACGGDASEQCGGYAAINVWYCSQNAATTTTTTTSTTSTITTTTSTTTSTTT